MLDEPTDPYHCVDLLISNMNKPPTPPSILQEYFMILHSLVYNKIWFIKHIDIILMLI